MEHRRIFGWDLPPGVNASDIPGNRPEDEAWDIILEGFSEKLSEDEYKLLEACFHSFGGVEEIISKAIQYGIDLGYLRQLLDEQEAAFHVSVARNEGVTKLLDLLREDLESGPVRVYPIPELVAKVNRLGEELLELLEKVDKERKEGE